MLKKPDYGKDEENNLTLLGFLCFKDPLKSTAKESIDQFRKLGVEVKILTGDSPTVAKTIVKEAGIEAREIPVGENITAMDDVQLEKAAEKANVFARLIPVAKIENSVPAQQAWTRNRFSGRRSQRCSCTQVR